MAEPDATPSDVPDVLASGLRIVFVGINPGRVSAAARAHFANPRNDFWRLLHAAGLTSRLYEPAERIARDLAPGWLAFVGKEAYRGAFGARADLGRQPTKLGDTKLFVLPSTSPANAAVPWEERLRWFRSLAELSSASDS